MSKLMSGICDPDAVVETLEPQYDPFLLASGVPLLNLRF